MNRSLLSLTVLTIVQSTSVYAYRCPATVPVDAQHNRNGWYIGAYTPQTGSYAGTINSVRFLTLDADTLLQEDTANSNWSTSGDGALALSSGVTNVSVANVTQFTGNLVGLETRAPEWQRDLQVAWPEANPHGAMHSIITQDNQLRFLGFIARSNDAMRFVRSHFEYRLAGSTDNEIDGRNLSQLQVDGETFSIEVVTEYFAPPGRGNTDDCTRLFHNRGRYKGYEIQLRPVVYAYGSNSGGTMLLSQLTENLQFTLQLDYDALPTNRPLF